MKITPKQYALTLLESVKGKKDEEIKKIIKKFVGLLVKNNDVSKLKRIIERFAKVYNEAEGIVEVEMTSAKELSGSVIKILTGYVKDLTKARQVSLKFQVDKDILGGVVLKYGDKILDGSLKARLADLKSSLEK